MKKIAALLTLLGIVTGCQKDAPGSHVPEQQSLTVLFSPGVSFNGAGYDDAILKAVVESMAEHPQVNHSLLRPETLDEARGMAQQWQENAGERSMLLLCGVRYEALAPSLSPEKGRVLLLDSRQTFENGVSTLQLKRYGGAYLAGALCVTLAPVPLAAKLLLHSVLLIILGANGAEDFKQSVVYEALMDQREYLERGPRGFRFPSGMCLKKQDRDL